MSAQDQVGGFEKVGECLYRYASTGVYYARVKVNGKEFRRSLKTDDRAFAKRGTRQGRRQVENNPARATGVSYNSSPGIGGRSGTLERISLRWAALPRFARDAIPSRTFQAETCAESAMVTIWSTVTFSFWGDFFRQLCEVIRRFGVDRFHRITGGVKMRLTLPPMSVHGRSRDAQSDALDLPVTSRRRRFGRPG